MHIVVKAALIYGMFGALIWSAAGWKYPNSFREVAARHNSSPYALLVKTFVMMVLLWPFVLIFGVRMYRQQRAERRRGGGQ